MLRILRRFAKARDGLAALEFALIAPIMIVIFFGSVELSSALDCNTRVARVSFTIADLVAQSTTVSTSDTTNIFNCANAILYPFSSSSAQMIVTSITYDTTGKSTVAWSDAYNTSKRTSVPSSFTSSLMLKDSSGNIIAGSVIYSEVSYSFSSPLKYFLGSTTTLTSSFFTKPRRSTSVAHS